jgi:hypothetical protein
MQGRSSSRTCILSMSLIFKQLHGRQHRGQNKGKREINEPMCSESGTVGSNPQDASTFPWNPLQIYALIRGADQSQSNVCPLARDKLGKPIFFVSFQRLEISTDAGAFYGRCLGRLRLGDGRRLGNGFSSARSSKDSASCPRDEERRRAAMINNSWSVVCVREVFVILSFVRTIST